MGKKLASTVYVTDPKTGQVTKYPSGTDYTSKLGKVITNESAWVEDAPEPDPEDETVAQSGDETPPSDDETSPSGGTEPTGDQTPTDGDDTEAGATAVTTGDATDDDDQGQAPPPPPRAGQGSGRDAWASYAKDVHQLEVPESSGRDDIIAFLEERQLIERETA